jgi:hypothetical protein
MQEALSEERYRAYRDAIRRRVCAVCLDSKDDGSCGLSGGRTCAIDEHLPRVVHALLAVRSGRMDEYVAALEAEICSRCRMGDAGSCALRDEGECGLSLYLPLVVDAIEEVGR